MKILNNVNLADYSTFGIRNAAIRIYHVDSEQEVETIIEDLDEYIILGEGSNTVFLSDIDIPIVHLALRGIHVIKEDDRGVLVKVGAGENWHSFVTWTVKSRYHGLENLALIPGSVGAAPVQNIGAYGAEVSQYIDHVRGYDTSRKKFFNLSREDCAFGYRDSIFKSKFRSKFIITSVCFSLSKGIFQPNIAYGALSSYFTHRNPEVPVTQRDVYETVIDIRNSKLPNPDVLGNAGSFFKNPVVDQAQYSKIRDQNGDVPYFALGGDRFKIPAAWLIEHVNWKGKRIGNVGVYEKHALVLVNYGEGTSEDLLELIRSIREDVEQEFGIRLEPEVNLRGKDIDLL